MLSIHVKLKSAKDAALFVAACEEYKDYDTDYRYGRYTIDSKSLLGLISVGFDHVCEVILHCDDEKVCNDFKNDMVLWTTDEPLDIATSW